MVLLHPNQSFQLQAVLWAQIRLVALNKHQQGLVPHHRHLVITGSQFFGMTSVVVLLLVWIAIYELEEKGNQGIDHLSGQSILLAQ